MRSSRSNSIKRTRPIRNAPLLARGRGVGPETLAGVLSQIVGLCIVLTSCAFAVHHSAPASTSPAPNPVLRHTVVAAPPPPMTTAPASTPAGAATPLAAEFTQLENKLHAKMGIAISAVGSNAKQLVLGDWTSGPAWSTMKVPVAITALRYEDPPAVTDAMRAAITESDNAAAESIWDNLGGNTPTAAHKVEAVLSQYGDPTAVEWRKLRPQFTAFGQTKWSLTNQVRFTAAAVCDSNSAPIFTLMAQVEGDQRWGLGVIPGTRFKGGWGPYPAGNYLVRQIGVLRTPAGLTAVAVATEPASGSFGEGTQELTEVSKWLASHIAELPSGQCN